ncbi:hypothetical protein LSTR_LSTR009368 [Laodelphax striatellus]|uniref:Thrombospondin-like N-terminal domain-containing protein n=1 Tax=Laodelphax striatellus TaxID=195883 RepID=A0A482WL70_LAOST|nr:hypothetical protein LSTR_LSTR009368 [Laodelphax striatellus]
MGLKSLTGWLQTLMFLLNYLDVDASPQVNAHSLLPVADDEGVNLLTSIKIPFDDPYLYFDSGIDGFPTFGLKPGSDIKQPYRLFMPEKFYPEFAITATVKLKSREGGFLFAVVNPLETIVQLGVQLASLGSGLTNISLLYTDVSKKYSSQTIASFEVPSSFSKWTRIAFKVTASDVALFFNCGKYEVVKVTRETQELVFDSASILYVGQAGLIIKGPLNRKAPQSTNIIWK